MAEISDFHRLQLQTLTSQSLTATVSSVFEEEHLADLFDFESFSPPSPSSLQGSTTFFRQSDYGSHRSSGNSIFFGDEDDDLDQMNFITDLFRSGSVQLGIPEDRDSIFVEVGSQMDEESDLAVGLESDFAGGFRVVDIESESDSEAVVEAVSGVNNINNRDEFHDCDSEIPGFWDSLEIRGYRGNDESEWEEVNEREHISSVIERIEEITVSSDGENLSVFNGGGGEEDNLHSLEWQVLLAVSDLDISSEFDGDEMLRDFVSGEASLKGSPPASKYMVENLPLVVLSAEYLRDNAVVCAVCKDEISVDEKVTKLPCLHHYHLPCIIPWLRMRNTCPVCRYEFPTDDADYEKRKNGQGGAGFIHDFDVIRYNYQLLP